MKLGDIGFYTLSDDRTRTTSWSSDLQRCELILTDRCNFKCAYCRGIKKDSQGDLTFDQAKYVVDLWEEGNLRNIRFSGGEPTVWEDLPRLIEYTKAKPSIEHIALSTNGSASLEYYKLLCEAGVNDFSISLDACCAMAADTMAGVSTDFERICLNIKELSRITYCTVGVVLDQRNNRELEKIIKFATSLGVSDMRIIPSAQSNHHLDVDVQTNYKILKYRLDRLKSGKPIRGMNENSCRKCHLVKDDMVVLKGYHYPCVIYMREQGNPIGCIYKENLVQEKSIEEIRWERREWFKSTDTYKDPICRKNCLDVCVDYNDKCEEYILKRGLKCLKEN